jgi:hypothetical protein
METPPNSLGRSCSDALLLLRFSFVDNILRAFADRRTTMSEQNKTVVRRLFEDHWNRKNRSLADELYAPSAILYVDAG